MSIPAFLRELSTSLVTLAEEAPDRMTAAQLLFFVLAAEADLRGVPTTFTAIREGASEAVNRSMHSTYRQLLEPSRTFPKALGWLRREENPLDNREKFLRLTTKGRAVVGKLVDPMERETA